MGTFWLVIVISFFLFINAGEWLLDQFFKVYEFISPFFIPERNIITGKVLYPLEENSFSFCIGPSGLSQDVRDYYISIEDEDGKRYDLVTTDVELYKRYYSRSDSLIIFFVEKYKFQDFWNLCSFDKKFYKLCTPRNFA